jgi:hypothetical protein
MDFIKLGGSEYFLYLGLLVFSRGLDFLSTWIATPNLLLEANPLARKLGWRWGIIVNVLICVAFACWPLPAMILTTASMLVAARNLQSAWLMRLMGEHQYRHWMCEMLSQTPFPFYALCVVIQALVFGGLGLVLMILGSRLWLCMAIGMGFVTYGLAIAIYSLLSAWRLRKRQNGQEQPR